MMGAIIIILVGIIGVGILSFTEGKRKGYNAGYSDGYEQCKHNFNKIQEFKNKILNKKLKL